MLLPSTAVRGGQGGAGSQVVGYLGFKWRVAVLTGAGWGSGLSRQAEDKGGGHGEGQVLEWG